MRRKYLIGPCLCSLATYTFGIGTGALLPLYAIQLGASKSISGLLFAFAYLCLTLGNMAPAVLPRGFRHRKVLLSSVEFP